VCALSRLRRRVKADKLPFSAWEPPTGELGTGGSEAWSQDMGVTVGDDEGCATGQDGVESSGWQPVDADAV